MCALWHVQVIRVFGVWFDGYRIGRRTVNYGVAIQAHNI